MPDEAAYKKYTYDIIAPRMAAVQSVSLLQLNLSIVVVLWDHLTL